MGRRSKAVFEYYKQKLQEYGYALERIGRAYIVLNEDKIVVFSARNYGELRAFLIGLEIEDRRNKAKGA